ncbi:MAG: histidine--tRNA ligase [Oscillospiraceae bacterium]|nr:histidine--tRNA ligase [Oscillospiraceae bacterium]MBR5362509.1 histidine--tRNA ligase [Oscillospiraceae bacterium]
MANYLKRPQGTEDVTPERIHKWMTVEKVTRDIAESFGFSEIRIPTFEVTELFQRSVGETTDVVQKEMYSVIARETQFTLRPEGTAGTIRAMLQNGMLADALPQKVFYQLSCFRHERPQAGRLREFHQFGVELAGPASPYADAEIILLAKTVLDRVGLKDVVLNLNSIGCPKCRAKYQEALKAYFEPHKAELCETCQERLVRNPMRLLDCKSPEDQAIAKDAPLILDYLCEECSAHFESVKSALTGMGVEFVINPKIVRGLDYYTRTVFEFITTSIGAQGTVCAGGRYDGLIEQLGGQPIPALGFGMGLERLILTMEQQGCDFLEPKKCDVYLAPMDAAAKPTALQYANALREMGIRAEFDLLDRSFKSQMKYANKLGAKYLVVLGSNELEQGRGQIKNMETGKQHEIRLDSAANFAEDYSGISLAEMFDTET